MNEINFHSPSHETLIFQVLFNRQLCSHSPPWTVCESASQLKHYSSTFNVLRKELDHSGDCDICNFSQYRCVTFFLCHQVAIEQCVFFLTASEQFMQWVLNTAHHWRGVLFAVNHNSKPIQSANQPLKKGGNGYMAMLTFSMSFTLSNWKVFILQSAVVITG